MRGSRQYMNAVWYQNSEQKNVITTTKEALQQKLKKSITTLIEPAGTFYNAEDYHQKFFLRQNPELIELCKGLSNEEFRDSRLTARLNALAGGYCNEDVFNSEILSLNLSEQTKKDLIRSVKHKNTGLSCKW
mmetsp:Transcript_14228/g.19831  ORF Transcript_14228/g.19831 Transcript_14228/m.19831 type:complete len:132 (-) Transcript_14228:178-573(-)